MLLRNSGSILRILHSSLGRVISQMLQLSWVKEPIELIMISTHSMEIYLDTI